MTEGENKKKVVTIVTHAGTFHADEVLAVAALQMLHSGIPTRVVRTRDLDEALKGDFLVDVGFQYEPEFNRYDHHQEGGAGVRNGSGIPYSSLGLVWKHFGEELCGSNDASDVVEKRLVIPIDAADCGMETYRQHRDDLRPYLFHNFIEVFRPSWREQVHGRTMDYAFADAVSLGKRLLQREIRHARDEVAGYEFVERAYERAEDKRIIQIDGQYKWERVLNKYPEPLFVIKPKSDKSGMWNVKTVRQNPDDSFANRRDLPEAWAGKGDRELREITGVEGAIFCHNKRFICVAESQSGAWELAKRALD